MVNFDEGKRFTDESYATKDDIKAAYNTDNVENTWEKVLSYRRFYDCETDLCNADKERYKICLTKKILANAYNLQLYLIDDLLKYSALPNALKKNFLSDRKLEALLAYGRFINLTVNNSSTIRKIANNEIENVPSSLFVLKAYSNAYDSAKKITTFDLTAIENINKLLIGEDIRSEARYRKEDLDNSLFTLQNIKASEIQYHLNILLSFLNDNKIPLLIRALSIIYVFNYINPFEYSNDETAALAAKTYLCANGFNEIGFALDFESIAYAKGEKYSAKMQYCEQSLDLTYFINYTFPYLLNVQEKYKNNIIDLNQKALDLAKVEPDITTENITSLTNTTLNDQLALPSFPTNNANVEDIENTATKLRQIYPQLKRKQAHFYAGHCTIGLHYSIEQFKECENTVYETARTSMEDLTNLGFYRKEQIGKKFVYTPIPMKDSK